MTREQAKKQNKKVWIIGIVFLVVLYVVIFWNGLYGTMQLSGVDLEHAITLFNAKNDAYENRMYYHNLTYDERLVYCQLDEMCSNYESSFVPVASFGALTEDDLWLVDYATEALCMDEPLYYWIVYSYDYEYDDITGIITNVSYNLDDNDGYTLEEGVELIKAWTSEQAAKVTTDVPFRVANQVRSILCYQITYIPEDFDQDPRAVVYHNQGVCATYSAAYKLIMEELGYRCLNLFGNSSGDASGDYELHAWNLVFLDDEPYYVDVTWSDNDENPGNWDDTYFLIPADGYIWDGHYQDAWWYWNEDSE